MNKESTVKRSAQQVFEASHVKFVTVTALAIALTYVLSLIHI